MVEQERAATRQAEWQGRSPALLAAQTALADAIRNYEATAAEVRALHNETVRAGFGAELATEFFPPPPFAHPYAFQTFVQTVESRQQMQAQATEPAIVFEPDDVVALRRFSPRKVPLDEIEAISPLAPPRRVHILHGPVRASNLAIGYARLFPGETPIVSARAAHALVASGCAEYLDEPVTVPAA
jgi:hypothetical protein